MEVKSVKWGKSIKTKIMLVLVVILIFLAALAEGLLYRSYKMQEEQLNLSLERKALVGSQLLSRTMEGYLQTLIAISYAPVLSDENSNISLAYLRKVLQEKQEQQRMFFSFALLDLDGYMQEASDPELLTYRGDTDWFQAILQGAPYALSAPGFSMAYPDLMRVALVVPVLKEGKLYRMLHARFSLQELSEEVVGLGFGEWGRAFLLDGQGLMLAHPSKDMLSVDTTKESELIPAQVAAAARQMVEERFGRVEYVFRGVDSIINFNPVVGTDWILAVVAAREEVFGELRVLHWRMRALLAGVFFLLLFSGWHMISRITRPLSKLTVAVNRLTQGDLGSKIEVENEDEIGQLAVAFEKMRSSLEELLDNTASASTQVALTAKSLLPQIEQIATVGIGEGRTTNVLTVNEILSAVDMLASGAAESRVATSIQTLSWSMQQVEKSMTMFNVMAKQTSLVTLNANAVQVLVAALEARDIYMQGHSLRVAHWARSIAVKMGLTENDQQMVYIGGLLHDIGKIGVREYILHKAGRLTEEEFKEMQLHPGIGVKVLQPANFPPEISKIVLWHHEDYGGGGYPQGIAGEEISLLARIIRVTDSYDAMTSVRSYRPADSSEGALAELNRCTGKQFDPVVVRAMRAVVAQE